MKNIHVLPTDKPSRLRYFCGRLERMYAIPKKSNIEYQNIYITFDEEIKEGDWFLHPFNTIHKAGGNLIDKDFKKIILSTDQSLDGVQAIDDEFLEWFVKNPSCEEVEIKRGKMKLNDDGQEYGFPDMSKYKIIIPKEEPCTCTDECLGYLTKTCKRIEEEPKPNPLLMDEIAHWDFRRQKSYSEEEVLDILGDFFYDHVNHQSANIEEWFKQFKNK